MQSALHKESVRTAL